MPNHVDNSYALTKKIDITPEGVTKVVSVKSFNEASKTIVSPDFTKRHTWYYQATLVSDEVATTLDQITYSFASGRTVINLRDVTDRSDWASRDVTIKKNGIILTSGFTVNHSARTIVFGSANLVTDVIAVSYSYENGSAFDLIAAPGKKVKLAHIEAQLSVNVGTEDLLVFEVILNNPNVGNVDYVAGRKEYYNGPDLLNTSNLGNTIDPFGGLTQKINVFPWYYLTGYVIKPVGDATTDPNLNEFNKIRVRLKNNNVLSGELATATFYCFEEAL